MKKISLSIFIRFRKYGLQWLRVGMTFGVSDFETMVSCRLLRSKQRQEKSGILRFHALTGNFVGSDAQNQA